ncbi:MAG: signal peptidase I [Candidatus Aenigmatarchaeota archaeon]
MISRSTLSWLVAGIILAPFVIFVFPEVVGLSDSYVVRSGSMEPAIKTGSIIFVRSIDSSKLGPDDVITFKTRETEDQLELTTHRIVEARENSGTYEFRTKGDANEDPDPMWVSEEKVVGRMFVTLPYLGYVLGWAKTSYGFVLLLVVPAVLIIANEILKINNELRKKKGIVYRKGGE